MDGKILKKLEDLEKLLLKTATKEDLKKQKIELIQKIEDTEVAIIARVDRFKADKDQLSDIEHRVERVEQKLSD